MFKTYKFWAFFLFIVSMGLLTSTIATGAVNAAYGEHIKDLRQQIEKYETSTASIGNDEDAQSTTQQKTETPIYQMALR